MGIQGLTSHAWSGLTPELLARARKRVRTVAWIMLVGMGLGSVFDLAYFALVLGNLHIIWIAASAVVVALCVVFVLVSRSRRVSHLNVLRAALAYEVVFCLFLAVLMPWLSVVEGGRVPFVTWVTPIIIFFPLIVPSPPRVTLLTAIVAAATRPLGLLILERFLGMELAGSDYVDLRWRDRITVGPSSRERS